MSDRKSSRREPKPVITWDRKYASVSLGVVSPELHERIVRAIQEKRVLRVKAKQDPTRIVEPHLYGERGGQASLLAFDPNTDTRHLFVVADLDSIEVLDATFAEARPVPPEFDPDRNQAV